MCKKRTNCIFQISFKFVSIFDSFNENQKSCIQKIKSR